ncbi:MAG TPA: alcohol dehydrogenase catalytic domain-containing protein [Tepidisphaeraceae bacterium]|jgi:2-desacetyl-2-hydroxyethyl bacteriochlorophyllide A dehydrogenase|nr:alcohol dehydrogenase catalytic domain-containing protein [Tepidisphaeraceae bacterium]
MKALVLTGKERVEVQEMPAPQAAAGEVLLRVSTAGICGSDIHGFLGHSPRRKPGLILGHEAVGVVAELGPGVKNLRMGQRVYVNPLISCGKCEACLSGKENCCVSWRLLGMDRVHGAYAEFVAVPASQLRPIPDEVSDQRAVWAEPLANIVHCFRISMNEKPKSMAILGAGTMGALGLTVAKSRGIEKVVVVDKNEARLDAANQIGADAAINIDRQDAKAQIGAVDYIFDAVGVSSMRRLALDICKRGGRIAFLGMGENESSLPFIDMIRNEQAIFTSFAYTPADFAESVRLIESGTGPLLKWTEHRKLDEGQESFSKMAHNPAGTLKLLFNIGASA